MHSGHALKKLARELGLEIRDGIACGICKGYAVSMWEGFNHKTFCISAKLDDELCERAGKGSGKSRLQKRPAEGWYPCGTYISDCILSEKVRVLCASFGII